jgi:Raf kinase inhibitor-like YbhB/YbcL family protein
MTLTSRAFASGGRLPRRYTCDGEGSSPPLRWTATPAATRELALLAEDLDAPSGTFVHWVVFGLPSRTSGLPAGTRPATLRLGKASSGKVGYEPPCPPRGGAPHRYVFTVYALRRALSVPYGAAADVVRKAIGSDAIASGRLTATYSR